MKKGIGQTGFAASDEFDTLLQQANSLQTRGDIKGALRILEEALACNAEHPGLLRFAGIYAAMLGDVARADVHFRKLTEVDRDNPEGQFNYGTFLQNQDRHQEAEGYLLRAIELAPELWAAQTNLGFLYTRLKRYDRAEKAFRDVLQADPSSAMAKWNLALLLLRLYRFEEGWKLYDARLCEDFEFRGVMGTTPPQTSAMPYKGEALSGRSLLIWSEQGIGDEIMFASILPDAIATGARITLLCDRRIISLMKRSFPAVEAIPKEADTLARLPGMHFDYHLAAGSLPRYFRTERNNFERYQPYLIPDATLVEKWRNRFDELEHPCNVGISWYGGATDKNNQDRSVSLAELRPLLEQPVNIINLQYGARKADAAAFTAATGIPIHDWSDAKPVFDLENFSAQVSALDAVVSIDNSTVHFAGALGTPTLTLLPLNHEWRWPEEECTSDWYQQTVKLYRQSSYGDWTEVIDRVRGELTALLE